MLQMKFIVVHFNILYILIICTFVFARQMFSFQANNN